MDPKDIQPGSINHVDHTPPAANPRAYWMVHGGESGKPSTVIHFTYQSAEAEARRLAEVNVGKPFFVLSAGAVFQVASPKAKKTLL